MALFAIAFAIPANKMARWKDFVAQLAGAKNADFVASRSRLRVRERTFHQQTPQGDFAIVTLEGEDPAGAFAKFGRGTDAFTQWFKAEMMDIHRVDLDNVLPELLPTMAVDSGRADFFSELSKWLG